VLYDLVGFSYNLLVLQALCLIVIVLNCLAWAFPAKPAPPTRSSQPSDRSVGTSKGGIQKQSLEPTSESITSRVEYKTQVFVVFIKKRIRL
jgi:hypothetical protein